MDAGRPLFNRPLKRVFPALVEDLDAVTVAAVAVRWPPRGQTALEAGPVLAPCLLEGLGKLLALLDIAEHQKRAALGKQGLRPSAVS